MMTRFTEGASAFGRSAWMRVVVGVLFLIPLHFMGLTEDASAQPPAQVAQGGAQDDVVDPPARVGRLSFISGTVSFRTLDTDQWQAAVPNYPVTTGLSFWTEPRSRATLQLGHGVLRMDGSTEIDVQQFDDEVIQISILQGSINFRLRSIAPDETYQILTPTGWVELNAPGRYRIDATTDGTPARVSVFEGSADVIGDNTRITVNRGQARPVELVPSPPTRVVAAEIDDFADQQEAAFARVPDYVSPDMPGIQDIVSIGAWESVPRYGRVWYPPVEAGWAPYRYGHWAFVAPWGWTWIDDAPWGFAPFHYGRWVSIGPRWAWVPGSVAATPVYAPALVAFVGGPRFGVSVGVGGGPVVGWVPLAPSEVFVPSYSTSINYVRNVNVTNVTNVTNINNVTINNINNTTINKFQNASAATVVSANTMTNSQPVHAAALKVAPQALQQATINTQAPVRPTLATRGAPPDIVKAAGGNTAAPASPKVTSPGPSVTPAALPTSTLRSIAPVSPSTLNNRPLAPAAVGGGAVRPGTTVAPPGRAQGGTPPAGPKGATVTPPSGPGGGTTTTPPGSVQGGTTAPAGPKGATTTPPSGPAGGTTTTPQGGSQGGTAPAGSKGATTTPPSGPAGGTTATPQGGSQGGTPPAGPKGATTTPPSGPKGKATVTPPADGAKGKATVTPPADGAKDGTKGGGDVKKGGPEPACAPPRQMVNGQCV